MLHSCVRVNIENWQCPLEANLPLLPIKIILVVFFLFQDIAVDAMSKMASSFQSIVESSRNDLTTQQFSTGEGEVNYEHNSFLQIAKT